MKPYIIYLCRLSVGAILIVSGVLKITGGSEFLNVLRGFTFLPGMIVPLIGAFLPFLEVGLGLMLVAGIYTRKTCYSILTLLFVFTLVILVQVLQGNSVECGCFGELWRSKMDMRAVFRNIGLAAVVFLVSREKFQILALDNFAAKHIRRRKRLQLLRHNKAQFVPALLILAMIFLSMALMKKTMTPTPIGQMTKASPRHKHFVFVPFSLSQQDSTIRLYYPGKTVLERRMLSEIPLYILADTDKPDLIRVVAFMEEDVACPTCRDVRYLVELDVQGEIVAIHFIERFESYLGMVSAAQMERFGEQFLGTRIRDGIMTYQPIATAAQPSRHFVTGLERLRKAVLQSEGQLFQDLFRKAE